VSTVRGNGPSPPVETYGETTDLVDEGTNLHPQVYAQVQKKLRELGD